MIGFGESMQWLPTSRNVHFPNNDQQANKKKKKSFKTDVIAVIHTESLDLSSLFVKTRGT